MSILDIYAPKEHVLTSYAKGQDFDFPFSFLEDSSIEVYEIIPDGADELRYLVPVTDYTLFAYNQPRYPVSRGGIVTFTRRHSANATKVVIERNTLIDQTIDFTLQRTFNPRQIEIAADKATLIAQELVVRKCEADVGDLELTQEVVISQYDDLKGSVIQFMIDKLTAILLAIDQSAEDCRANPELT